MAHPLPVMGNNSLDEWTPTDVHNWEGKETNILVLNYTMACALSCDFCCYGCHPGRKEKMPLDSAINLVEQAADMGVFSSVGFTGGEVMLFFEDIVKIGHVLKKRKLPFTIATAAHWAKTADEAKRVVSVLVDLGLIRLNISHDPSHAKFVPSEYVINVARAGDDLGIATYIVGTFYSPDDSLAEYLPELTDLTNVKMHNKYVSRVGRASKKNITQQTYGMQLNVDDLRCYRQVHHDMVVFYDGETYPCCSTFNRATPGISLGNAFTDSLQELYQRAEGSLLLRMMKRQGFGKLYEVIKELDADLYGRLPSVEHCVSACSLCNQLFRDPKLAGEVFRVFAQHENLQLFKLLDLISVQIGEEKAVQSIQQLLLDDVNEPSKGEMVCRV